MNEWKRYRVRPAGNTDPDCEFDIEAFSPDRAAKCVAEMVGNDTEHRRLLVEVYTGGTWVVYDCRPRTMAVVTYSVSEVGNN
jgi:hypothetical protein